VRGIDNVTLVQELGQPSLTVTVNRAKLARYGLSAATINGLSRRRLVEVPQPQSRTGRARRSICRQTAAAVSLDAGADRQHPRGDSIGQPGAAARARDHPSGRRRVEDLPAEQQPVHRIQYSVEGRDLASAVQECTGAVESDQLATGYSIVWGGEYEEYTSSRSQLIIIFADYVGLIFLAALLRSIRT